ncbi:MAG: EAL domain-containing protein [bacterium]
MKNAFSENREMCREIILKISEGVMITDPAGSIIRINPAFCLLTGYSAKELIGNDKKIVFADKQGRELDLNIGETLEKTGEWTGKVDILDKSQQNHPFLLSIFKISCFSETCFFYLLNKPPGYRNEIDLNRQFYNDPLTDLANRQLFKERLALQIERAKQSNKTLAVIFLDLDHFTDLNDALGDDAGDELLKRVAGLLKKTVRTDDTLARLGDDEFAVIIPDITKAEYAVNIVHKIVNNFKAPIVIQGHELFITLSIGISVFPENGQSPEILMKNADVAMYRAKEEGRNCYKLYTSTMNAKAFERLVLENNLRKAIERNEFILHYQPQISLSSGEIMGMEALVRWQHPELGLIPPVEFIPLAEETGLIIPLGEWTMKTACAQCAAWRTQGYRLLRVAVNLSARQFQQLNLEKKIADILTKTGLDSSYLELEITESAIMDNVESAIITMQRLHDQGIHISIDDFGTGYSSLSYLKKFPIKTLKIDRSFVSHIDTNPDDRAIATAIIAMAHSLNLKVVGEGVETREQLNLLLSLHCDEIQGYYFSKPLDADLFVKLLSKNQNQKFKIGKQGHYSI